MHWQVVLTACRQHAQGVHIEYFTLTKVIGNFCRRLTALPAHKAMADDTTAASATNAVIAAHVVAQISQYLAENEICRLQLHVAVLLPP